VTKDKEQIEKTEEDEKEAIKEGNSEKVVKMLNKDTVVEKVEEIEEKQVEK